MKILWLATDRRDRCMDLFGPFREAVAMQPDVSVDLIERPLTMTEGELCKATCLHGERLVSLVDPVSASEYDLVVTDAMYAFLDEEWSNIKTAKAMLWGDHHGKMVPYYIGRAFYEFGLTHFFPTFYDKCAELYPMLFDRKVAWRAHSIDPELFNYSGQKKTTTFLQLGVVEKNSYPVRQIIADTCSQYPWYKRSLRPPEQLHQNPTEMRRKYVAEIQSARLAVACVSHYSYVVSKITEIPACNTALVCDYNDEMRRMGFVPGENFFEIKTDDRDSIHRQVVNIVYKPIEEMDRVAKNGYDLIHSRHTNDIRAKEFVSYLINNL